MLCAVLALALGVTACGSDPSSAPADSGQPYQKEVRPDLVPSVFAGFTAAEEDISKQRDEAGPTSYLVSTRLWSLRQGTKLEATLQVGLFAADAFPSSDSEEILAFKSRIVAQIGAGTVRRRVLGGTELFVSTSNEQPVYIWFPGHSLCVLTVVKDHPTPRALVRQALELTTTSSGI